jgi:hypothetical protein
MFFTWGTRSPQQLSILSLRTRSRELTGWRFGSVTYFIKHTVEAFRTRFHKISVLATICVQAFNTIIILIIIIFNPGRDHELSYGFIPFHKSRFDTKHIENSNLLL